MNPAERSVLFFLSAFIVTSCAAPAVVDVALVQFFVWGEKNPTSSTFAYPAFAQARGDLASYKAVMNFSSTVLSDPSITTCDQFDKTIAFWATLLTDQDKANSPVSAIFGPGCPTSAAAVAQVAATANIPMLIGIEGDAALANKKRFPTLTRMSPYMPEDLSRFVSTVLRNFKYDTVGILCDDANDTLAIYGPMCTKLFDSLRLRYNTSASRFYVKSTDPQNVKHYLEEMKFTTRVIIIIAHGDRIRPIMLAASDSQMTGGDYVYFTFELYPDKKNFGSITWNTGDADKRDADARTAFSSLFVISLHNASTSPEYRNFSHVVKLNTRMFNLNFAYQRGEEINPFAVSYYYALTIYSQVLNQLLKSGGNLHDGAALSKLMWNRTFTILGQDIVINANGDRDADWTLSQIDSKTGIFQPVMEYSANRKTLEPARNPVDKSVRKIVWFKRDTPPPNEPKCGYRGTKPGCGTAKG
ncbi:atrial natriuretic peptide receptor 1-like [Paramacrobiotus metropolitanus]|uniref:atrial natriuretic peptide receptor 1-like n=1 Tax=Paramacrobiotus metropolitanus TaxID=2943436 RepID=UPI002445CD87|nr:atrial natriuretic peptide receptor 1-like [Paramacrobiotus metropolitanus]